MEMPQDFLHFLYPELISISFNCLLCSYDGSYLLAMYRYLCIRQPSASSVHNVFIQEERGTKPIDIYLPQASRGYVLVCNMYG